MCNKFYNLINSREITIHSYYNRNKGEIIPYHRQHFYTKPNIYGVKILETHSTPN